MFVPFDHLHQEEWYRNAPLTAKLVIISLYCYGKESTCESYGTIEHLAKILCINRKSVIRAIRYLREFGAFSKIKTAQGKPTKFYLKRYHTSTQVPDEKRYHTSTQVPDEKRYHTSTQVQNGEQDHSSPQQQDHSSPKAVPYKYPQRQERKQEKTRREEAAKDSNSNFLKVSNNPLDNSCPKAYKEFKSITQGVIRKYPVLHTILDCTALCDDEKVFRLKVVSHFVKKYEEVTKEVFVLTFRDTFPLKDLFAVPILQDKVCLAINKGFSDQWHKSKMSITHLVKQFNQLNMLTPGTPNAEQARRRKIKQASLDKYDRELKERELSLALSLATGDARTISAYSSMMKMNPRENLYDYYKQGCAELIKLGRKSDIFLDYDWIK